MTLYHNARIVNDNLLVSNWFMFTLLRKIRDNFWHLTYVLATNKTYIYSNKRLLVFVVIAL